MTCHFCDGDIIEGQAQRSTIEGRVHWDCWKKSKLSTKCDDVCVIPSLKEESCDYLQTVPEVNQPGNVTLS